MLLCKERFSFSVRKCQNTTATGSFMYSCNWCQILHNCVCFGFAYTCFDGTKEWEVLLDTFIIIGSCYVQEWAVNERTLAFAQTLHSPHHLRGALPSGVRSPDPDMTPAPQPWPQPNRKLHQTQCRQQHRPERTLDGSWDHGCVSLLFFLPPQLLCSSVLQELVNVWHLKSCIRAPIVLFKRVRWVKETAMLQQQSSKEQKFERWKMRCPERVAS